MASIYDCQQRPAKDLYQEIDKDFSDMTECLDKASKFSEEGKIDDAISMYEFAISVIDKALSKPIESPSQPDLDWERAYAKVMKMRKSRKEALSKISDIQARPHPDAALPPPSYEEAMALSNPTSAAVPSTSRPLPPINQPYLPSLDYDVGSSEKSSPGLYPDITPQLNDMRVSGNHEIIYSHNNVRVYFIAPDGRVSSTMEPDTLIIGRIEDLTHDDVLDDTLLSIVDDLTTQDNTDEGKKGRRHGHHRHRHHRRHRKHDGGSSSSRDFSQGSGQIYLRVGSWVYPLIPGISPCFRSDYGAFILPDVHSQIEGAAVGLILPASADSSVYELLSSILCGVVGQEDMNGPKESRGHGRVRRNDRADKRSENRISTTILRGASYVANNLVRGADSASRFLDNAAPHIMNRITPNPEPQPVNPTVQTSMNVARSVSSSAANVTDFLATKVGSAASALGQYLAPHIQRQGTRLLTSTTSMSQDEASKKMSTFLDVSSGAVQGIATVYSGLEGSAGILGRSLANNTVQIIKHKYGQPAGDVTNSALSTAGNIYSVQSNMKIFKPKGMAKTLAKGAVKGAGAAMMEDANAQSACMELQDGNGTTLQPSPLPPPRNRLNNPPMANSNLSSGPSSGEVQEGASYGFKSNEKK